MEYCIERCCAFYCFNDGTSTYPDGQFGWLYSQIGINKYLSISYCSPIYNLRWTSVLFYSLNITISSTNSSNNYCYRYSSLFFYYVTPSIFNFSIISNNIGSDYGCIVFQAVNTSMNFLNIVNNSVGTSYVILAWGHIGIGSNISFINCIFFNNKLNFLFGTSISTITVIDCWSNEYNSISGVTFINKKGITSPINLTLFKSAFCDAKIPLIIEKYTTNIINEYYFFNFIIIILI